MPYQKRREQFLSRLGAGVAILPAAPELLLSRDTEVPFRQNSDLFYLTGYDEPGAVAVLTPHDAERRFTLFVRPRDPERERWNGCRAGVEGARERFGADAAYPIDELGEHLATLAEPANRLVYALGGIPALDRRIVDLLTHFRRARQRTGRGPFRVEDPDLILGEMRVVKDASELEGIRAAAAITVGGHRAAMRIARPEIGEWEIEAALESVFRAAGASGPAFPSIVGSGPNATTLHYVRNGRRARAGELVLVDAGAAIGMYAADVSRTFPVSGRFSAEQRTLYEIVLAAENAAIDAVRPGGSVQQVHQTALGVLVRGMIDLGLLHDKLETALEEGTYKMFYPHQTSHWLGLDVHDVGLYSRGDEPVPLRPGMVLTVEPGLYIPEDADDVPEHFRGIGIRIEDDVVVAEGGREVLTRGVPVEIDEVEAMVGRG